MGSAEQMTGDGMEPPEHVDPEHVDPEHLAEGLEPTAWPSATVAPMELSVAHPEPGVSVIEIAGELDALTTPLLDECLREQRDADLNHLVIDLSAVTFLGSSGMAALVECVRKLEAEGSGSKVHLTGTSHRAIRRPLELVGLLPLFSVHATQDEAMADIAAGPHRPT